MGRGIMHYRLRLLAIASCLLSAQAFTPGAKSVSRPLQPLRSRAPVICTGGLAQEPAPAVPPLAAAITPALPGFEWPIVFFFMANPLVLLPVAAAVAFLFKLRWLGAVFSLKASAAMQGVVFAVPLLLVSLLADKLVPALAEVTQASKTISLYAMGTRRVPLRACLAAVLISTSAAVAEELAFRGVLQTGVVEVLSRLGALPPAAPAAIALAVQAAVFGALHAYSAKCEYLAVATLAGLAFGFAFASTGNVYVPIVMHFIVDVVGFLACHWQVTDASEEEQRALMSADTPIAQQLAAVLGPRLAARSHEDGVVPPAEEGAAQP